MTIVSAMGQIFYSLFIAMGILITFGSYMKKEVSIKGSKENVEIFVSIPWWRSHPIHENRATESIWTEPCNPLLRATKSTKRATSIYETTLIFCYLIFE